LQQKIDLTVLVVHPLRQLSLNIRDQKDQSEIFSRIGSSISLGIS